MMHGMARFSVAASALGLLLALGASAHGGLDATSFYEENEAAMAQMMKAMHQEPSGDVDRDFATMMIAHHQGAIDMARAQLRYGNDPALQRLAQEIIVTQQQEIVVMQRVLANGSAFERPSNTVTR